MPAAQEEPWHITAWNDNGKAPRGFCPWCGSVSSVVQKDGWFRARCSHRMCGASGPRMRKIERAVELFSAGKIALPRRSTCSD
jgi:hypothetical protein